MKATATIFLVTLFTFIATLCIGQVTLRGRVTDKKTGEALPGATIFLPDLKTGVAADTNGAFLIKGLPESILLVSASYVGYAAVSRLIDLSTTNSIDFEMAESYIEFHEVVVVGNAVSSDNSRTSITITPVGRLQLITNPATNLVNNIAAIPGISAITTGSAISKPVIRGLSYNRVVTVHEGIRQEGNQWGDEHGLEIDQFSAERIEILKGPASLFFGSDAMGGVVNILEPIPAPLGEVRGEVIGQYSGNARMVNTSAKVEGNHNGYHWRLRGTYKDAGNYKTAKEFVANSGFSEYDVNGMFGINKKWGYTHLHLTSFNTRIGMIEGEGESEFTRIINLPFQKVNHLKAASVTNLILKKNQLKVSLAYQVNDRREYEETADYPGLFLHLNTYTYEAKYSRSFTKSTEIVAGFSGMSQDNTNKGEEILVPDYRIQDWGGFVYGKQSWERWTLNAGLRYDSRKIFFSQEKYYSALTGSAGFTYNPERLFNLKFNIGRAFRSPNVADLASDGVHPGTGRYEIGNPDLKAETSVQADAELDFDLQFLEIRVNGYCNLIDQFIYLQNKDNEVITVDGEEYPVYRFIQGNSMLTGFELEVDLHPWEWLHFANSLDYVYGVNRTSGDPLPYMPPLRLVSEIKATLPVKGNHIVRKPYIQAGFEYHWKQDRTDPFESPTAGYFLLNASAGLQLRIQQQLWTLFISCQNLTNTYYVSNLNALKDSGVYDMGRNITIGVIIPFGVVN